MRKFLIAAALTTTLIISTSNTGFSQSEVNNISHIQYPLPDKVPVTSNFGMRRHPVLGVKRLHAGIDLGAAYGTPVLSALSGKVVLAKWLEGYGYTVVTRHEEAGVEFLYAHLSKIVVSEGQDVKSKGILGNVGATGGVSTGPHLHWETRRITGKETSQPIDPNQSIQIALNNLNSTNNAIAESKPELKPNKENWPSLIASKQMQNKKNKPASQNKDLSTDNSKAVSEREKSILLNFDP